MNTIYIWETSFSQRPLEPLDSLVFLLPHLRRWHQDAGEGVHAAAANVRWGALRREGDKGTALHEGGLRG